MEARVIAGGSAPTAVWINGAALPAAKPTVALHGGANAVLLRYDKPGRGQFVLESASSPVDWKQTYPLSSRWYHKPGVVPFDTRPAMERPAGWYE